MGSRSRSTIDRDHSRAREHQAWVTLQDYRTIDWISVEDQCVLDCISQLEEFLDECENEDLVFQLQEFLDSIQEN